MDVPRILQDVVQIDSMVHIGKTYELLAQEVERKIRFMGSDFPKYWRWVRLGVSLQARLFVEQVLSGMGFPWNRLAKGFDPITVGDRAIFGTSESEKYDEAVWIAATGKGPVKRKRFKK